MFEEWQVKKYGLRVWGTSRERILVEELSTLNIWKTRKYSTALRGVLPGYRLDSPDQDHFQGDTFYTVSLCFTLQMNTIQSLSSSRNDANLLWRSVSVNHSVPQNGHSFYIFNDLIGARLFMYLPVQIEVSAWE